MAARARALQEPAPAVPRTISPRMAAAMQMQQQTPMPAPAQQPVDRPQAPAPAPAPAAMEGPPGQMPSGPSQPATDITAIMEAIKNMQGTVPAAVPEGAPAPGQKPLPDPEDEEGEGATPEGEAEGTKSKEEILELIDGWAWAAITPEDMMENPDLFFIMGAEGIAAWREAWGFDDMSDEDFWAAVESGTLPEEDPTFGEGTGQGEWAGPELGASEQAPVEPEEAAPDPQQSDSPGMPEEEDDDGIWGKFGDWYESSSELGEQMFGLLANIGPVFTDEHKDEQEQALANQGSQAKKDLSEHMAASGIAGGGLLGGGLGQIDVGTAQAIADMRMNMDVENRKDVRAQIDDMIATYFPHFDAAEKKYWTDWTADKQAIIEIENEMEQMLENTAATRWTSTASAFYKWLRLELGMSSNDAAAYFVNTSDGSMVSIGGQGWGYSKKDTPDNLPEWVKGKYSSMHFAHRVRWLAWSMAEPGGFEASPPGWDDDLYGAWGDLDEEKKLAAWSEWAATGTFVGVI